MESLDHSFIWDVIKFILTVIVVPFGIWIVTSHIKVKSDIADVKEETLKFKEEVAKSYAAKTDMASLAAQIDSKLTGFQNAVTQRIDTMQANLATMIASLVKKGD